MYNEKFFNFWAHPACRDCLTHSRTGKEANNR